MKRLGSLLAIVFMLGLTTPLQGEENVTVLWNEIQPEITGGNYLGIAATTDGGSVLAGRISGTLPGQTNYGLQDAVVGKYDIDGNTQWLKQYGTSSSDELWDIKQTKDGGYIGVGYTLNKPNASLGNGDGWLLKLNSNGEIEWSKQYGDISFDLLKNVEQTADGGYLATGNDGKKAIILKTDANGNQVRLDRVGDEGKITGTGLCKLSNGNYVISGYIDLTIGGRMPIVLKVDANGNLIFKKIYNDGVFNNVSNVVATMDGGYVFGGTHHNASIKNGFLVKCNASGDVEWKETYFTGEDFFMGDIIATEEGFVSLASKNNGIKQQPYIIKTDTSGKEVFSQFIPETSDILGSVLVRTKDNGYVSSGLKNGTDIYVYKLKIEDLVAVTPIPKPDYPKPSEDTIISTVEAASKAPSAGDMTDKTGYFILLILSFVVIKRTNESIN